MTEGGKCVYKTKKIHKRKSDSVYCVLSDATRPVSASETPYGEFDSTLKHQYLQYIHFFLFHRMVKSGRSTRARARFYTHKQERTRSPVIRNRIEIETNEHTKPNSNSSSGSSSREKIQLENLYEANSVHVMLSKYIHRLKTRASHLYSMQHTHKHTHTLTHSLSIGPIYSRSRLCCFHFTIPYDTMCARCAVERVCVCVCAM